MDLFLTNMQLFPSQDVNWWTGVVCITCGLLWCFYQLFGLWFWRHPFTAEDPLLRQWCNATFLQICSDEETSWMVWGCITWMYNWVFTESVPPEFISTAFTENKPWPLCTRWPSSRNACWAEERRASPTGRWRWAAPASPWKPRSCGWGWWPGNRPSQSAPPAGYRERNTAGVRAAVIYRNAQSSPAPHHRTFWITAKKQITLNDRLQAVSYLQFTLLLCSSNISIVVMLLLLTKTKTETKIAKTFFVK